LTTVIFPESMTGRASKAGGWRTVKREARVFEKRGMTA